MESSALHTAGALGQLKAYEVDDVTAFLAAASAERFRLRVEVADAHARVRAARARLSSTTPLRDRLGSILLEARRTLMSRRADVELAVSRLTEAAEAEAEALVANARAEAATLRSRTALLHASNLDGRASVIDLSVRATEVS